ncbi:putative cinnamoyl-CoA reductase [Cryphonectria parasitica EP155]|uniref:Cinnamoyl-CoA reductase n=1 Tax=Cryphonectria parasitica (strain ATCC 38755 / EP155) TaxID=660469 RepID=A0A9P4Y4B6_CRYP1|nr:putative cinnamoyl-CoA reductase [Cryphonectria parasitica EP155]KAF3766687.1 putative cinnamoyl-CoA reductase [Cryphonectria parasitica EP155]
MTSAQEKGPVLVTGGSGFVALELLSQLLSRGYTVHATVRSLQNHAKVQPLRDLRDAHGEGQLLLFEADLLQPDSFRPAMQGCHVVYHVASPFKMAEKINDGQKEMIEPALHGTRNVLKTVQETPTVTRVVLTSSIGAIAGDYRDVPDKMDDQVLSERYFNETSSAKHNPYHQSKVLAEKEAWRLFEAQEHRRWDLVALCVGLVLGPTRTSASESGSLFLMGELLAGWMFYGVPDLCFLPVDIRDVATAHIKAAEVDDAAGRYLISPPQSTSFLTISKHFKKLRNGSIWLPAHQIPSVVTRIVGPLFGLTQLWMSRNLGIHLRADNSRSVSELGMTYRSLEQTLNDHYTSWEENRKRGSP